MRRKWQKPTLRVLVRGTPQERVLWTCKASATNGSTTGVCSFNPDNGLLPCWGISTS